MECNKEEAIRAKALAEKKMQNKDFVGARKLILKVQQLCSNLENISQMLTVCDVHCSAEHKMLGCEMDWYGILQIEQTADEASIKKQYRKLALLLHPDKNTFAGAEAAFKLIGEAHGVLSDQSKRSMYDMKRRASLRTSASKQHQQQQNRNSGVSKQPGVNNNFVNIPRTQSKGVNTHQERQQTKPGFSNDRQTFWTACPSCNIRYQYYKDNVLNKTVLCQSCMKPFVAYALDAQSVAPGSNSSQPYAPNLSQGGNRTGPRSNIGSFPSGMGFQWNFGSGTTSSAPFPRTGVTSEVGSESKMKGEADREDGMDGKSRPNFESGKPNSKKRRKFDSESSESCDTESSIETDEEEIFEEGGLPAGQNFGFTEGRYPRRSARQKQHVSYNEDLSDNDDFVSPSKKSRGIGSINVEENQSEASQKEEAFKTNVAAGFSDAFEEDKKVEKQEGNAPDEESSPNGNDRAEEFKKNKKHADLEDKERSEVDNEFKSNSGSKVIPDAQFLDVPDPEFYDFDKDRKEECFAAHQTWAVYDNLDGMPRFYAQIRKVFSPGFKVRIAWLQVDPRDQNDIDWLNGDLPISCGEFKYENSEITEDIGMFSHLVLCEKGTCRTSYKIYPRKGEIWALFKNWDIKWSSDPEDHRNYVFEFVEVLSNFAEGSGVTVACLVKVKGFVSLFRLKKGMISFQIPPNELYRFSHRVPSCRTTGTEREDVPEGYFELDPASLPDKLEQFSDLEDLKENIAGMDAKINSSCSKSPMGKKLNSMEGSINRAEKNTLDRGNSKSRNQSPRESDGGHKKQSQANVSQCMTEENKKHSDCVMDGNHNGSTHAKVKLPDVMKTSPNIVADTVSKATKNDINKSKKSTA